ncbi:hypothetical protein U0070_009907 [Myodes glareolus]|uniref:Uncharacterized protein n=1 Tax=Myodes glareolus TaxID=447135 RepID=A0AAW0JIT8_MYOGA
MQPSPSAIVGSCWLSTGAWLVEQSSVVNVSLRKDVEEVTKGMKLLMFSASESGKRREQMRVIPEDGYSEKD